MMTYSCWRAHNETRRYIAPSDVGGDLATVRLFAQATERPASWLAVRCRSTAASAAALPTRRAALYSLQL
jgi:hypothetical protein